MLLKIGARGSPLSLAQTSIVAESLKNFNPGLEIKIVPIKTSGDDLKKVPVDKSGLKGLFVKEIEAALLAKEIDLAVHSAKDLPGELPEGLGLGAVPERLDFSDVLVAHGDLVLSTLPSGSVVGTSSLRRRAQILAARPDLVIKPIRGNLGTRLSKLKTGDYQAIVLAQAGLLRLGQNPSGMSILSLEEMLPAAGQGILALELRLLDRQTENLLKPLNHQKTRLALLAERAVMIRLGAGCHTPAAALAFFDGSRLIMKALVADLDGSRIIKDGFSVEAPTESEVSDLGADLALRLLAAGGDELIAKAEKEGIGF